MVLSFYSSVNFLNDFVTLSCQNGVPKRLVKLIDVFRSAVEFHKNCYTIKSSDRSEFTLIFMSCITAYCTRTFGNPGRCRSGTTPEAIVDH